jgi:hypothetical protein
VPCSLPFRLVGVRKVHNDPAGVVPCSLPVRPVGVLKVHNDPAGVVPCSLPVRPIGVLKVHNDPAGVGALVENVKLSYYVIRRLKHIKNIIILLRKVTTKMLKTGYLCSPVDLFPWLCFLKLCFALSDFKGTI